MSRTLLRTGLVMLAVIRYVHTHPGCSVGEAATSAAAAASAGSEARLKANGNKAVKACLARGFIRSEPAPDRPGYTLTVTTLGLAQITLPDSVAS